MPLRVHMVHHTRDRVRLRIPEKRKDIRYFVDLYEDLREIPGVSEVVINPATGSVLLFLAAGSESLVFCSLQQIGLLGADAQALGRRPGLLCRLERFFDKDQGGAAHVRTLLFTIVIALAIHQVRHGKLLIPAISVLLYAYDLFASHKKERGFPGRR